MINPLSLPESLNSILLSIRQSQRLIDLTSLRLATGKKVNSALDNPQSYFVARELTNRAADISRLLDGIGSGIRTIEEASNGITALEKLLNTGESYVQSKLDALQASASAIPSVPPLSTQILSSSPVAYWQLNESSGTTATNLGSIGAAVNGTYLNSPTLGSAALYTGAGSSVGFNGTNQSISVPNNALINTAPQSLRSVELVFNANTTSGRQVLYEEGGTGNAFSIYLFNGSLYVNGRDSGAWGPVNISAPVVAGQTYHAALTFDFPSGVFNGYLNGVAIGSAAVNSIFAAHGSAIGIGRMNNDSYFHDGPQSGNSFYFDGRISDVAIYNSALTAAQIASHAAAVTGNSIVQDTDPEFEKILNQIDLLVKDAQYRGINLLMSDTLKTYFNEANTSSLETKGVDFTSNGLGIKHTSFATEDGLKEILQSLRLAVDKTRAFGSTLANNLNIIKVRDIFSRDTINVLNAGASDLVNADQNEEGANLLAAQTRQNLAITSLSFASRSYASVLNLFA